MPESYLRIAREAALLSGLPPEMQQRILSGAQIARFTSGATVFVQGDEAAAVYIVADGWVKLYRVAPSGAEAVVSVMTRGRSFGEAVALRGAPYPVSAEAITDAVLVRIDGARLRQQMHENPALATAILAGTFVHLQSLVAQVEQLKARSGVQRVAEFLADLALCREGACEVLMPYNKALIAGRLGMKPESLSRAFNRLRSYGVRMEANVAHIEDVGKLRALAAEDPGKAWMK
ncbi:Crp/Fnr family transcriptional regulator [Paracoccus sp. Z118]|uniref:Crp/Fnr family transcriptional regulator n=1 Tax=Paracoccus sp. Z118 TaxID=2851017 RepID=UPI001C2C7690|nr:Crp/Fnr family transcriptional regulator [Paracoccus sp. Z118]MBV0891448.1 Crp/Fnr family transcriptional regulator [Paracoccus sp. Z118]